MRFLGSRARRARPAKKAALGLTAALASLVLAAPAVAGAPEPSARERAGAPAADGSDQPEALHKPASPGPAAEQSEVPASEESTNWSGYEDTGQGAQFTQVSASWNVPTLEANITGSSSTWVGIDGTSTPDLIQAGTEQDWTVSGPLYYAWYELLPGGAVEVGAVHPGDHMTVGIDEAAPGKWTVTIDDTTSGSDWTEHVSYNAPGNSAEWVVEAPSSTSSNAVEPLAAFGSVTFSGLSATGPGTAGTLAIPVYLVHQADDLIEAYPGPYEQGADTFTDYFGSPTGQLVTSPTTIMSPTSGPASQAGTTTSALGGYWLVGADGGIFAFGGARFYGSTGHIDLHEPVVAIAPAKNFGGYWLVAKDGGVFGFGGAPYLGSLPSLGIGPAGSKKGRHLSSPVVGAAATPAGSGYYMVTASGAVFTFGNARYEGSCGDKVKCEAQASAIVPDAAGGGYWLLLSGCEMVAFGNAPRVGSADCQQYAKANQVRAVAAAPTPTGGGYWVLLSNGAVFPEGDAKSLGHWQPPRPAGATQSPAVALVPAGGGTGIWVAFADGIVKAYGSAALLGDAANARLSAPIVAGAGW